jgi:hypothetical protein
MPTWTELERRFLELEPALRSARLDQQSGTEGEYWRVAASFDPVAKSRFESLATIAGRKLRQTFAPESLPEELRDAPSEQFLWYRAISRNLRFYTPGPVAYPVNDKGERVGWIATGSINNPTAVSAAHCLELAAMTSEEENPAAPLTIHVSGQNARLNVGSIDNSSNVANSSELTVFEDARRTIAEKTEGEAKDALLAKLQDLQDALNTPSYATRYKEFMQTAADHVTVLGPVLAALAGFLS